MAFKGIVFDMDGVLIDSEYTYNESKTDVLKDAGREKDISYQFQFSGTTYEFMWQKMKDELALEESIDYYITEMNKKRHALVKRDGVIAIKGVQRFVTELAKEDLKLAVASSSPKSEIMHALAELNIAQYFEVFVSGEEVAHSKPAPDVFLEACRQLELAPNECLAFEDTKNGSLSATRAGLFVFGFQNPDYETQDLSADILFSDFAELNANQLVYHYNNTSN